MPFSPGKANRRVTIQAKTQTRGASGGFVDTWTTAWSTWAELVSMTSSEARRLLAQRSDATIVFRMRYRSDLTALHRVYYSGKYYNILGDPVQEDFESVLVTCRNVEEVAAA